MAIFKRIRSVRACNVKLLLIPQLTNYFIPLLTNYLIPLLTNYLIPLLTNYLIPLLTNYFIPLLTNYLIPLLTNYFIPLLTNYFIPLQFIEASSHTDKHSELFPTKLQFRVFNKPYFERFAR